MSGRTRREAAKNRVGRNDRLGSDLGETKNLKKKRGSAEARKGEEMAKDRVSRNDWLTHAGIAGGQD